jgi:3-deoxy-manno-octulosonate cytidylyltransferase (CMP-KDO synthetase)
MTKILGIIPARYASTRFPGKPLTIIGGKSMIRRVYEQASCAVSLSSVIVATDDERIRQHVLDFGGKVVMTSSDHPSGTDRCYEAMQLAGESFDIVVNIQGDEPFIHPKQIDLVASCFSEKQVQIATLVKKINGYDELTNPNIPKVALGENRNALLFSRQTIPYLRGVEPSSWLDHYTFYKHIGIYAYRAETLAEITSLNASSLEKAESLEQLRWLENGYKIKVEITDFESVAIDTPEDLKKLSEFL